MNMGNFNMALTRLTRALEMTIVVNDPRKGKSVVSEGALLFMCCMIKCLFPIYSTGILEASKAHFRFSRY
jgi:hypothetical protein